MPRAITLSGSWRFRRDPKLLGELFTEQLNYTHHDDARWMRSELDDAGWETVQVPHTWPEDPEQLWRVAWYRRTFEAPQRTNEERVFLEFDGIDYNAEIWLNDRCLGSHEGYFGRVEYEVGALLRETGNVIAVRVESPVDAPGERSPFGQVKTAFKGSLSRWDMNDPEFVPGGLWRDVRLVVTGANRVVDLKVSGAPDADVPVEQAGRPVPAFVAASAVVDIGGPGHVVREVDVELELTDGTGTVVHREQRSLALGGGRHEIGFAARLERADLWWPWDLGEPALHDCAISVRAGAAVERSATRFGIRSFERRDGTSLYVNGLPIFQRGANYMSDVQPGRMDRERYERDIALMREANLNTVHPFCHVEMPDFYDLCDEQGLLVYQDFPVWLMLEPGGETLRRAQHQIAEMVTTLYNHASICIWNCSSQPSRAQFEKASAALALLVGRIDRTRVVNQANATFAYTADFDIHEDYYIHPEGSFFWPLDYGQQAIDRQDWRWDVHNYAGWYWGEIETLAKVPREHLHLVTEFGAQGLPDEAHLVAMLPDGAAWPPDWDQYARRAGQAGLLRSRAEGAESLTELVRLSQEYQARLVRGHVEYYRRHKFRPCNGAHLFEFNDAWPSISWSVVDYERTPKLAFHALRDAMAPLQVFLGRFVGQPLLRGEALLLALTVVNDTPARHDDLKVRARMVVAGEVVAETEVPAATPALGLSDVEGPSWEIPSDADSVGVELELVADGQVISANNYEFEVHASA
jgi:beta-mannosidase